MQNIINKFRYNSIITVVVILFIVIATPMLASAQNTDAGSGQSGSGTSGNATSNSDNATQKKLQGQNLEKCQNREMAINNVMARIGDRGEKQIAVIESIQQKVQTFYADKNISVNNYDSLITNVETKKQTATMSMNNVRTMKNGFGCTGDDPKGVATQFKAYAMTQSDDITEYKNAVHDLVLAIKAASSTITTEVN